MITFFNKNILVVGAKGTAKSLALECAKDRANMGIFHHDKNELVEIERELGNLRIRNYGYKCDMSLPLDINQAVALYKRQFDSADFVIINIDLHDKEDIIETSFEDVRKEISSSVDGSIFLVKHFLPDIMRKQSGGFVFLVKNGSSSPVGSAALGAVERFSSSLNSYFRASGYPEIFSSVIYVSEYKQNTAEQIKKIILSKKKTARV